MNCKDHPRVAAVARCASCSRALCGPCFRFRMDGRPACARCAYEASTRPARRVSLAVSFLCFAFGGGFWASRRHDLVAEEPLLLVLGGAAALVVAGFVAASGKRKKTVGVALAAALGAAWVFVELLMPFLFFFMYWLFMRAIGRVARERWGGEGNAVRSLGWGAVWATIYVAQLAGLTWALHAAHGHHGAF